MRKSLQSTFHLLRYAAIVILLASPSLALAQEGAGAEDEPSTKPPAVTTEKAASEEKATEEKAAEEETESQPATLPVKAPTPPPLLSPIDKPAGSTPSVFGRDPDREKKDEKKAEPKTAEQLLKKHNLPPEATDKPVELFQINGYLRMRTDLFINLDLRKEKWHNLDYAAHSPHFPVISCVQA